jgi:hypothetical protein
MCFFITDEGVEMERTNISIVDDNKMVIGGKFFKPLFALPFRLPPKILPNTDKSSKFFYLSYENEKQ